MLTTIIFLLVLTLLVFIHELGHFLAARLFKIRVDEFAIGFPPRVWSFMRKGTRFALNIIPLGGYVRIHGENAEDSLTPDSILSKPRWQQAIVLVAGVFFNIILTWLFISLSFMIGARSSTAGFPPERVTDQSVMVMYVSANAPAEEAGLKSGDRIVSVASSAGVVSATNTGTSSLSVEHIQNIIAESKGAVTFNVISGTATGASSTIPVEKVIEPREGVVAGKRAIGISMEEVGMVKLGFFGSLAYGAKSTWIMLDNITRGLGQFVKGLFVSPDSAKAALKTVSGPVGIASIVGTSAKQGFASLLVITAIISANLAVINLMPFPALDGGRLVVVAIEGTIRRRINPKVIGWINACGFLLLIGLMIAVTFKDIFAMF